MPRPSDGAHLKAQWFHILLALCPTDRHGSEIARAVEEQTDGELTLWPATLYGALQGLVEDGLIRELDQDTRPSGESERRRYYRITSGGREALALEADRLAGLARAAHGALDASF
jgi:DNA-binding PadR family transcriptional regulator